jgi:general secretion pathway protein L
MSRRLIGIEIGGRALRIAMLNRDKGQITVSALLERSYADDSELTRHLNDLLSGEFRFGDQLVTGLLARSAYVRRLKFPFQEEKKIAAALPFELSAQLPVSIDDCATAMQKVEPADDGAIISAAAVPKETLQSLLELFERANVPLQRVDLAPFCYAAGLGERIGDGLLVCATDQETTVSLLQNGQLTDYRVLPATAEQAAATHYQALLREVKVMAHVAAGEDLTVSLMGSGVTPELEKALQDADYQVDLLSLNLGGELIDAPFLPAVALALRAKTDRSDRSFNFRRGPYALKGEWANQKKKLALLVALLGMILLLLAGSMTVKYIDKARRAEQLQSEMVGIYRSLFPDATTIVDVPMQLQSAILDLQSKNSQVSGTRPSALAVLKEVSRLPELVTVEIQEFSMGPEDLKMTGRTASFEAVNQMARVLEESSLFANVQVADAKMSLDGSRIDFRLSLSYAIQRGEQ